MMGWITAVLARQDLDRSLGLALYQETPLAETMGNFP